MGTDRKLLAFLVLGLAVLALGIGGCASKSSKRKYTESKADGMEKTESESSAEPTSEEDQAATSGGVMPGEYSPAARGHLEKMEGALGEIHSIPSMPAAGFD